MTATPDTEVNNNSSLCFLNGDYLALNEAKVSVLDRGFIFADGIYEVIPAFFGKPFRLEQHLKRLSKNLQAIKMENPYSMIEWHKIFSDLIAKNNFAKTDCSLYLQVTRGVAKRDHIFPDNPSQTVFVMLNPMPSPDLTKLEKGLRVITREDIRWQYCHIKSISLLGNIMLKQEASENNADETVLIRNGNITEGSSSNIFIVKNNTIITPEKNNYLLPGITRDLIVEIAKLKNLPLEERAFNEDELFNADEVWLSSSLKEVSPVCYVDNKPIANGKPGEHWRNMFNLFQEYKASLENNPNA